MSTQVEFLLLTTTSHLTVNRMTYKAHFWCYFRKIHINAIYSGCTSKVKITGMSYCITLSKNEVTLMTIKNCWYHAATLSVDDSTGQTTQEAAVVKHGPVADAI